MTVQSIGAGKLVLFQDGTLTASTPTTFSQTWNNSGVQFYGLKIGITDTASATSSEPFSIQVGGSDVVTILKSGEIQSASNIAAGTNRQLYFVSRSTIASSADGLLTIANNAGTGFTGLILGTNDTSGIRLKKNTTAFNFRLGDDSADASFTAASATLSGAVVVGSPTGGSKGNGTVNATGLYVNGTAVSTAASLIVGTTVVSSGTSTRILYDNAGVLGEYTLTGTGTIVVMQASPTFTGSVTAPTILPGASTVLQFQRADSTNIFNIATTGHALWNTDNTYDIGASGATRPRNIYAGTSFIASSGIYLNSGQAAFLTTDGSNSANFKFSGTAIGYLSFPSAASTQHGQADAAVAVAQILRVQSVVAGTAAANGANWTMIGSLPTGTGTSGDIIFQTGVKTGSGTTQGAATTAMTIKGETQAVIFAAGVTNTGALTNTGGISGAGNLSTGGNITCTATATTGFRMNSTGSNFGTWNNVDAHTWNLGYGATGVITWTDNGAVTIAPNNSIMNVTGQCYSTTLRTAQTTVSGLPSASTSGAGALAFVTDASTTVILGLGTTVVGSGSNKVPVYSDGTNWIVG